MKKGVIIFFCLFFMFAVSELVYGICSGQTIPIILSSLLVVCVIGTIYGIWKVNRTKEDK